MAKLSDDLGPCWEWPGSRLPSGYGRASFRGERHYMHRLMWELRAGKRMPKELMTDHLCRNPCCCNPDHLEAVTPKENTRRAVGHPAQLQAAKTHCANGHPFNKWNTFYRDGKRICKKCKRERSAAKYRAMKASAVEAVRSGEPIEHVAAQWNVPVQRVEGWIRKAGD